MKKFKIYNANNQQKYIKIKIINLGVVACSVTIETALFNDMQTYNIAHAEGMSEPSIKHFINDSDIVLLVADLDDDFVIKNILTIINVLTKYKKMFLTILANVDISEAPILQILKSVRDKSSLLVVENQNDFSIKSERTISQKFKKIIYSLCDLIDVEIKELCVQETILSSLISLNSFFGAKCELYLYAEYTEELARLEVKQDLKLGSLLKESNQIWIRHPFVKEDQIPHNKISNFIDFFESQIDEDATCFLSPNLHSSKATVETKVTVLIAISNNIMIKRIEEGYASVM